MTHGKCSVFTFTRTTQLFKRIDYNIFIQSMEGRTEVFLHPIDLLFTQSPGEEKVK